MIIHDDVPKVLLEIIEKFISHLQEKLQEFQKDVVDYNKIERARERDNQNAKKHLAG